MGSTGYKADEHHGQSDEATNSVNHQVKRIEVSKIEMYHM